MNNFINYLQQAQKTYEFKIKFANIDPTDIKTMLENALNAYGLESLSAPKRLPIAENVIDFPALKNCEMHLMDAVLTYPVTSETLRAIISERACVPASQIVVIPKNHPEELWRNNEGELREFKQGETAPHDYPVANEEQKSAGKFYSEAGSLLKELKDATFDIDGTDKTDGAEHNPETVTTGKTLNDVPTNDVSPVGSKQNKIPSPVKGK